MASTLSHRIGTYAEPTSVAPSKSLIQYFQIERQWIYFVRCNILLNSSPSALCNADKWLSPSCVSMLFDWAGVYFYTDYIQHATFRRFADLYANHRHSQAVCRLEASRHRCRCSDPAVACPTDDLVVWRLHRNYPGSHSDKCLVGCILATADYNWISLWKGGAPTISPIVDDGEQNALLKPPVAQLCQCSSCFDTSCGHTASFSLSSLDSRFRLHMPWIDSPANSQ